VWLDSDDISGRDLIGAGSLFVVVDTLLGPVYLAYGAAEGGRESFYLFLGQTF
jgi:NTE family protein